MWAWCAHAHMCVHIPQHRWREHVWLESIMSQKLENLMGDNKDSRGSFSLYLGKIWRLEMWFWDQSHRMLWGKYMYQCSLSVTLFKIFLSHFICTKYKCRHIKHSILGFILFISLLSVNFLISVKLLFRQTALEEQISLQRDAQKASEVLVSDG